MLNMFPEAADDDSTTVVCQISAPVCLKVEPVGRWYQAYISRRHHRRTLSHTEDYNSSSSSDYSDDDIITEDEDETFLLTLDPKEWKKQDHYRVLGLGHLRYKATDQQIKKAHKMKVLKHHPDKRKRETHVPRKDGDDDYFTCITKAYEILGHRQKRIAYDSVDPEFDDSVPFVNQDSKDNFFEEFTEVFERNSRWSTTKRVPKLGDMNSSRSDVNHFYGFWYDLDSWREYSYLDEEEKDKGQDRDERRWIEKQNKIARQKRKKEEMARIRQLVDNAYACDPRIKKFKDDEKKRKEDEKRARQEASRLVAEEREKERQATLEAERLAREKEEEEARVKAQAAKKEKDALKKAMKKEKKMFRDTCKKYNYFTTDDAEALKQMQEIEKLCEKLNLTSLQELNQALKSGSEEEAKQAYHSKVQCVNEEIEKEKREMLQSKKSTSGKGGGSSSKWDDGDLQLLTKGVNLFPAGTGSRWEVIAGFINQHSTSGMTRNAKDVISKAKSLQKLDPSVKDAANKKAFDKFEQSKNVKGAAAAEAAAPSERYGENGKLAAASDEVKVETPKQWSAEEQKLLEQALKTYPASTAERWDKISAAVPTRTRKECMKRYKDLVEMVKAKKAVQAQASKGKKI